MKDLARVAVLGLGDFGYHLACELHDLGHEVMAVDNDAGKVQQILPCVTKAAVADVGDRSALEELGIASFDLAVVCVGERLETTVLLVHHLRQWRLGRILVKVSNEDQAEIVKLVGATDAIHPERSSARRAALLIHHPRTLDYLELGGGHLVVAGRPPAALVGTALGPPSFEERFGVVLLGVWRPGQDRPPCPPCSERRIAEDDLLIVAGRVDRLRELRRMK